MIVSLYQNEQRSLSFTATFINSISRQTRRTYHLKRYHSQTSTNGHLSTMATYLQWALFTSRRTVHTFTLILNALQQQQPLKHVPAAKITSCQLPVNQRLMINTLLIEKNHKTLSLPHIICPCFCLVSV